MKIYNLKLFLIICALPFCIYGKSIKIDRLNTNNNILIISPLNEVADGNCEFGRQSAFESATDTTAAVDSAGYSTSSSTGNIKTNTNSEGSFFSTNLLYFVGAAVVATLIYIAWPEKEPAAKTNATFGTPLPPK